MILVRDCFAVLGSWRQQGALVNGMLTHGRQCSTLASWDRLTFRTASLKGIGAKAGHAFYQEDV